MRNVVVSWQPGAPQPGACPGSAQLALPLLGFSIEEILADSEDEDSEEEERSRGKEQRRLSRQRSQAWLKEGGGDEPLNFLDPKVAQRVLGKQESAGPRAQKAGLPVQGGGDLHGGHWEPLTLTHAHCCAVGTHLGHRPGLTGYDEGERGLGLVFHLLTAGLCHASHTAWDWPGQEEGPWLQSERRWPADHPGGRGGCCHHQDGGRGRL